LNIIIIIIIKKENVLTLARALREFMVDVDDGNNILEEETVEKKWILQVKKMHK